MGSAIIKEKFVAYGHENIQSTHPSTLEFTKEKNLTKNGDCIIAVAANKALTELSLEFKEKLRKPNAKLTILIEVDGLADQITAFGSTKLILTHSTDFVVRKSDYISDRTLAINADKSAKDLKRELVEKLKNPKQKVSVTLTVYG